MDLTIEISRFAGHISKQQIGLVKHSPEEWATVHQCFGNVANQVAKARGGAKVGWTFLHRITPHAPGNGYLIATNHAVWHSPDGSLIDVTPFHPDAKHKPLSVNGSVVFLVDDAAAPVTVKGVLVPQASRFWAIDNEPTIHEYVAKLARDEEEQFQTAFGAIGS